MVPDFYFGKLWPHVWSRRTERDTQSHIGSFTLHFTFRSMVRKLGNASCALKDWGIVLRPLATQLLYFGLATELMWCDWAVFPTRYRLQGKGVLKVGFSWNPYRHTQKKFLSDLKMKAERAAAVFFPWLLKYKNNYSITFNKHTKWKFWGFNCHS